MCDTGKKEAASSAAWKNTAANAGLASSKS